jgi:hypothetical protein
VHTIYALFYIVGYSEEALQIFKDFLDCKDEDIYDPLFLAQMVLSPLNTIVDEVLIPLARQEEVFIAGPKERNKLYKLNMLFRFEILKGMLDILRKYGTEPAFVKQPLITKLLKNPTYGVPALQSSQKNKPLVITGATAAFFLTLPEFFAEWVLYKNSAKTSVPKEYEDYDFPGAQCNWPTFSNPNKRKTSEGSTAGAGCMLSNPKSPNYDFLPNEVLKLRKIFRDVLLGFTTWTTPSLQTKKTIPNIQDSIEQTDTNINDDNENEPTSPSKASSKKKSPQKRKLPITKDKPSAPTGDNKNLESDKHSQSEEPTSPSKASSKKKRGQRRKKPTKKDEPSKTTDENKNSESEEHSKLHTEPSEDEEESSDSDHSTGNPIQQLFNPPYNGERINLHIEELIRRMEEFEFEETDSDDEDNSKAPAGIKGILNCMMKYRDKYHIMAFPINSPSAP